MYLICDPADLQAVAAPAQHLFSKGLDVVLPAFDGEPGDVRSLHEEQLRTCDAVLLYYGAAKKPWFEEKLSELRKIFGQGRTRPFLAKVALVAEPDTPDKALILTREVEVQRMMGPFSPDAVDGLVRAVEGERA